MYPTEEEEEEVVVDSTTATVTTVMKGIQIKRTTTIPNSNNVLGVLPMTVLFVFVIVVLGFVLQQQQQVPVEHNA